MERPGEYEDDENEVQVVEFWKRMGFEDVAEAPRGPRPRPLGGRSHGRFWSVAYSPARVSNPERGRSPKICGRWSYVSPPLAADGA